MIIPMKKTYELDGNNISTKEAFYEEFTRKVITTGGQWWGRNLDALNDVLRGGFGTPKEGFILIWKNATFSQKGLGDYFDQIVSVFKEHKDIELKLE